ncbi:Probable multidrug resistance-associated protein lethal(2)03659 [Gryllus bimaculatus]|nr:Probable multidrug resistance-associated protein lethal(2)03659 [Gryllus bimaculatus]
MTLNPRGTGLRRASGGAMDPRGARGADRPPNPRARASPLSALTFGWVLGTFWRGYQRDLEVDDLTQPLTEHRSDLLGDVFEKRWSEETRRAARRGGARPSLTRVLARVFGVQLALYGLVLAAMELGLRVAQPIFLGRLVLSFSSESEVSRDAALGYAAGVVLCSVVDVCVTHPYFMGLSHMGMKMRVGSCSLLYRKALRLSKTALGDTTAGQVVNLLANDVARFDLALNFLHHLWVGPVGTALVTYIMYCEVGVAAVVGVVTVLLFIPLQAALGKRVAALRLRAAGRTDARVRLMGEMVGGVRAIKMHAWERPFQALAAAARRRELKCIESSSHIRGVTLGFMMYNTRISIFASVLAYVFTGGIVTPEKVFLIVGYYKILGQTMAYFFPVGLNQLAEVLVSIRRIENFLLHEESPRCAERKAEAEAVAAPPAWSEEIALMEKAPEKPPSANNANNNAANNAKNASARAFVAHAAPGVELSDASAKWSGDAAGEDTLSHVTLSIGAAQCVAVVGQVGAGKTSLLHALLRELPLRAGTLEVRGRVSYASQEPWMFAGSVRQNILFGEPFDRHRYNQVLRACALDVDLENLPYSDETMVGDRGISLSGGQRARINLARAVYKDADIYLLDDPLSAVDARVSKHLVAECIKGYLAGKVIVLVTHQLQHLQDVDHIYVMCNGSVLLEGTFAELQESETGLLQFMETDTNAADGDKMKENSPAPEPASQTHMSKDKSTKVPSEEKEAQTLGVVAGQVYTGYFAAGGNWCVISTLFLLFIATQVAASGADYWITYWAKAEEHFHLNHTMSSNSKFENSTIPVDIINYEDEILSREDYIFIYASIIAAVVILSLVRSFVFFRVCIRASQYLHNVMFRCVTHAKMIFFNANPSGRILNRFSKDMGAVDEILPQCMMDTFQIGLALLGIVVVVVVVNYWLIIPTVIMGIMFYLMRQFYLATSRSVKRLEGIARSPVFSHLTASLQGLTTIRACRAEDTLIKEFDNHQDLHSSASYMFIALSRAFGFWLDFICAAYITVVTFSFFVMGTDVFGGNVGLAITQAIALTSMFQWGMRQSAEMENQMTAVERIMEYSNLEQEPPLESPPGEGPPSDWPSKGCVVFKDVSLKYNPSEAAILKNLNFQILPGEKKWKMGPGYKETTVPKDKFPRLLNSLVMAPAVNAESNIKAGFEKCGIISFNPNTVISKVPGVESYEGPTNVGDVDQALIHLLQELRRSDKMPVRQQRSRVPLHAEESVGIVGRTGAGKSSLISALFRLAELEGTILLDNIDTSSVGLHDLRHKISIIPQEPVLFTGTLRKNLDPFDEFDDMALLCALDEVELGEMVHDLPAGLSTKVSEGGSNFSVGQRQLVCLARAILRDNRVLVLDEATANVDPQTDALIQKTICQKFASCTVLTIAHRLQTIMDSDRVLVMDEGSIVEFGHPRNLLENKGGHFYKLVHMTGHGMAKQLTTTAEAGCKLTMEIP